MAPIKKKHEYGRSNKRMADFMMAFEHQRLRLEREASPLDPNGPRPSSSVDQLVYAADHSDGNSHADESMDFPSEEAEAAEVVVGRLNNAVARSQPPMDNNIDGTPPSSTPNIFCPPDLGETVFSPEVVGVIVFETAGHPGVTTDTANQPSVPPPGRRSVRLRSRIIEPVAGPVSPPEPQLHLLEQIAAAHGDLEEGAPAPSGHQEMAYESPVAGLDGVAEDHSRSLMGPFVVPYGIITKGAGSRVGITTEERFGLRLLDLCDRPGVPLYFFDEVIKLLEDARVGQMKLEGVVGLRRSSALKSLFHCYKTPSSQTVSVPIEGDGGDSTVVKTIVYNVIDQVKDLLSQYDEFANLSNLAVHPEFPWDQSRFPKGLCEEVMHGSVVQQYLRTNGLRPCRDICIPIILYLDEIAVTDNGRVSMRPVIMALGIFSQNARYLPHNTRVVGYIPKFDTRSKAQKQAQSQKVLGKGRSVRNFQRCFQEIINSVQKMQVYMKSVTTVVRLGKEMCKLHVHCPLVLCIGDGKELDTVACRYAGYTKMARLSRMCDVHWTNSDDPHHQCTFVKTGPTRKRTCRILSVQEKDGMPIAVDPAQANESQSASDKKESQKEDQQFLKNMSTHLSYNALWSLDVANQKILPLPHDPMHMFSTICRVIFDMTISCLPATKRAALDELNSELFKEASSSGERGAFPRMFFSRGFTSVTNLTCDEVTGTVVALLVLVKTDRAKDLLNDAIGNRNRSRPNPTPDLNTDPRKVKKKKKSQREDEIPPTNNITLQQMLDLLEDLLEFYSWYKYGYPYQRTEESPKEGSVFYWDSEMEKRVRFRVQRIQKQIITLFPRAKGNGWKRQKFHDWIHFASLTTMYGLAWNFDAAWGESRLKTTAKKPLKNVRKQYNGSMVETTSLRHNESNVILTALHQNQITPYRAEAETVDSRRRRDNIRSKTYADELKEVNLLPTVAPKCSKWTLKWTSEMSADFNWVADKKGEQMRHLPSSVLDYLMKNFLDKGCQIIEGFSEMDIVLQNKGEAPNGTIKVRSHPNYRQDGPWYEWCLFNYEDTFQSTYPNLELPMAGATPKEVFPGKVLAMFTVDGGADIQCLIHPCNYSTHRLDSRLMEVWEKDFTIPRTQFHTSTDENGNESRASVAGMRKPKYTHVWASTIYRRIFVVEESPEVCEYMQKKNIDERKESTRIVYVRDMIEYWPLSFDRSVQLDKPSYLTDYDLQDGASEKDQEDPSIGGINYGSEEEIPSDSDEDE